MYNNILLVKGNNMKFMLEFRRNVIKHVYHICLSEFELDHRTTKYIKVSTSVIYESKSYGMCEHKFQQIRNNLNNYYWECQAGIFNTLIYVPTEQVVKLYAL